KQGAVGEEEIGNGHKQSDGYCWPSQTQRKDHAEPQAQQRASHREVGRTAEAFFQQGCDLSTGDSNQNSNTGPNNDTPTSKELGQGAIQSSIHMPNNPPAQMIKSNTLLYGQPMP